MSEAATTEVTAEVTTEATTEESTVTEATTTEATTESTTATPTNATFDLRNQAADKRAQAAKLIEKAEALEQQADSLAVVFDTAPGTVVTAKRRDGSKVAAVFVAAKDTGRGVLVAVTVGEGFESEQLRLPLSSVTFNGITTQEDETDPLAI